MGYRLLAMRFAEVWKLSPIAPGINPDCAIRAKGDDLSGWQSGDLFDLSGFVNSRWVSLRHASI